MSETELGRSTLLDSKLSIPMPKTEDRNSSLLDRIVELTERLATIEAARLPSPHRLKSWEEIEAFAKRAASSGMVPKGYRAKPDAIAIAVQMGDELGLPPIQALNSIAVINGRPGIYGDAMPGICWASGKLTAVREWETGEYPNDDFTRWCEVFRRGIATPFTNSFSIADAKVAKLWSPEDRVARWDENNQKIEVDNDAAWHKYPKIMMKWRARIAYRDAFPDVLRGLLSAEELRDIAPEEPSAQAIIAPPRNALERIEQRYTAGASNFSNSKSPAQEDAAKGDGASATARDGATGTSAPETQAGPEVDAAASGQPKEEPPPKVMCADGSQTLHQWITSLRLRIGLTKTIEDVRVIDQSDDFKPNMDLIRAQKDGEPIADRIEDELDERANQIAERMRQANRG